MHRTVTKAARCCCCFVCTQVRVRMHQSMPSLCLCAHIRVLVQRAAAAASCSLHHCAMHLCVSRDATNGSPSCTAIYFDFNDVLRLGRERWHLHSTSAQETKLRRHVVRSFSDDHR